MRSTTAVGVAVATVALVSGAGARPGSAEKSLPTSRGAKAKTARVKPASKKPKPAKPASKKPKSDEPESKKQESDEPESEPTPAEPEIYSSAMVGAGVALTILGTGGVVAGTTWAFVRGNAHSLFSASPLYPGLTIAGGSALLLAGIPLWIVGAGDAEEEPAKGKAAIRITPLIGPTHAGLHVQF